MNNYLADQTGQQNGRTFTYGDGPRVGRPITGGRSWFSQWTAQKNTSTPVAVNDPPEHLPDYNPRERLSIMQQRDASGDLADPWSSIDHGALVGLFGHLPFRRRLPIEQTGSTVPTASSTGTWHNGVHPLPVRNPLPGLAPPTNGASDNGGASDPTTTLEQQLTQQMTDTAPLGGIGATVPVEQQTIGGGGGGSSLPVLALLAVAIGAIAFLYLRKRKKPEAEGNAVAAS